MHYSRRRRWCLCRCRRPPVLKFNIKVLRGQTIQTLGIWAIFARLLLFLLFLLLLLLLTLNGSSCFPSFGLLRTVKIYLGRVHEYSRLSLSRIPREH